jgi:8-amino-7-oxononanoate synthase
MLRGMPLTTAFLTEKLNERQFQGNMRALKVLENVIDLTSNDYLGFARSKVLYEAIQKEHESISQKRQLSGATGSRLLTGNSAYAEELENFIAKFHKAGAAVIYNCGYMANLGILTAVAQPEDTILYDVGVHASTYDGLRLCRAKSLPWRNNDLNHLEARLKKACGRTFVCVESLYSMSGVRTPLAEICALCQKYNAQLIVDEAHATGILGPNGEGLTVELGLSTKVFARIHTFGKALGVHGAAVVGSVALKKALVNFSRPFIYTTALPPYAFAAIRCAYKELKIAKQAQARLKQLREFMYATAAKNNLPLNPTGTPIQPFYIPGNENAMRVSESLLASGIDVRPILSPTVPKGQECLRFCLHAFNTEEEIEQALNVLNEAGGLACPALS